MDERTGWLTRYSRLIETGVKLTAPGQEQRNDRNSSSSRPQFEFITVSGTNIRGDAETRRRVRSRAQADYRRRNPPPPRNALTIDLDVGSWLQTLPRGPAPGLGFRPSMPLRLHSSSQTNELIPMNTAVLDPLDRRDGVDVFTLIPPDQRRRARQLWNHCSY